MARSLRPCLLALVAMLCLPAAGQADVQTFGSDLTHSANAIEHHGADSAFWNTRLSGGQATAAPADGQVTEVKVKGTVIPDPAGRIKPLTIIHFQVLHPMGDGSVKVELSSGAFFTPLGGDPQFVSTYQPINLCVHRGDYVDFNDIGGNEWHWGNYDGMPFQTFSRVSGSTTDFYTADNGTNIGSQWRPAQVKQGEELLMQTRLATGPDATDICPGGYQQHVFQGTSIRAPQVAILRTRTRTAKIRITCPNPSYGSCKGTLRAEATIGGRNVTLGSGTFSLVHAYSTSVEIQLTRANVRAIQRARGTAVRVVVDSHDEPGADPRANPGVPVQSKSTSAGISLKPDKPLEKTSRKKKRRPKRWR